MCSTRGREEWGGSARKRVRGIHEKDTTGWMFQKSVAIIRRSDGRAAFFDMSAWILICLSSIMNQPPIIDAIRYNLTLFAMIENKVFWIQLLSQLVFQHTCVASKDSFECFTRMQNQRWSFCWSLCWSFSWLLLICTSWGAPGCT